MFILQQWPLHSLNGRSFGPPASLLKLTNQQAQHMWEKSLREKGKEDPKDHPGFRDAAGT